MPTGYRKNGTKTGFKKGHKKAPNAYSFPKGNPTRFKKGNKIRLGMKHSEEIKVKIGKSRIYPKGKEHPKWKGGFYKTRGYIYIYKPNHPSTDVNNYVKKTRLVIEKKLGRYLTRKEVVHHINKVRDDDRIQNLKLFPNKNEHMKQHRKQHKLSF